MPHVWSPLQRTGRQQGGCGSLHQAEPCPAPVIGGGWVQSPGSFSLLTAGQLSPSPRFFQIIAKGAQCRANRP